MKNIFLISIAMFLVSCSDNILTDKTLESQYIVTDISEFSLSGHCKYELDTKVQYFSYNNHITIVDKIGLLNIGDTVHISLTKYVK